MFKSRKTKILSFPTKETVLEVLPEVEPLQQIVAIDYATVKGNVKYIYYGTLTDYDGYEYDFEWDDKQKRLCRLVGSQVNDLIWNLSSQVLATTFKVEDTRITQHLESLGTTAQNVANTLTQGLKELDNKIERLANVATPVAPKAIEQLSIPMPKPVLELEVPQQSFEEQEISPEDDEISLRALQFLQSNQDDNVGVDYLSL